MRGTTNREEKGRILGGGPNRIGRESSSTIVAYVRGPVAREEQIETIMVNCNPETVSTDYTTPPTGSTSSRSEEDAEYRGAGTTHSVVIPIRRADAP